MAKAAGSPNGEPFDSCLGIDSVPFGTALPTSSYGPRCALDVALLALVLFGGHGWWLTEDGFPLISCI